MFFQAAHIGPMFGQFEHFYRFAGKNVEDPYPKDRYRTETRRLLEVLESRLSNRNFIMSSGFSIADIAVFPWVRSVKLLCALKE